tara:strand:- start:400 stop:666 length:267 start_codon:yes stop_codon:yes gene_type:complete
MVTLLPVVLARDQLTIPFGGSILVEQAEIKDRIRATAKAVLIVLNIDPFLSFFRVLYLFGLPLVPYHTLSSIFISLNGLISGSQYNTV